MKRNSADLNSISYSIMRMSGSEETKWRETTVSNRGVNQKRGIKFIEGI